MLKPTMGSTAINGTRWIIPFSTRWLAVVILALAACSNLTIGIESVPEENAALTATIASLSTETAHLSSQLATLTAGLTPGPQRTATPTPSADASRLTAPPPGLVYQTGDGFVWRVDSAGEPRFVLDRTVAAFSPDGNRVLYSLFADDGTAEIWVADLNTGERRNLTDTRDRRECCPNWWPARPEVVVLGSRSVRASDGLDWLHYLTAVGPDGSGYQVLDDEQGFLAAPALSPDGSTIAYGNGQIVRLYAWGEGPKVFDPAAYGLSGPKGIQMGSPAWSPDGKRLAWVVGGGLGPSGENRIGVAVFEISMGTSEVYHLYEPIGVGGWPPAPKWSPDGRWIAFEAWDSNADRAGVWAVRVDGQGEDEVHLGEAAFAWSPDGRWLAVSKTTEAGLLAIWVAEVGIWEPVQVELPPDAMLLDWVEPGAAG